MEFSNTSLDMQQFFPENLKVCGVSCTDSEMHVELKSTTREMICPYCGQVMKKRHTSHYKTVQDLPVFHKRTYLKIAVYDFDCTNTDCKCVTSMESIKGFVYPRSKMTERLEALVAELALHTSCEGAARILKSMNVKISGDTVIRVLIRRYEKMDVPESGSCIGVDDFSFKKGKRYGTIIADGETHVPLTILEGRDGKELKEWLKGNRQVTAITRDRASAYAKAIEEVLPEAMQIADRFHLYQNLMSAVKKIVKAEVKEERESKKNAM